MEIQETVRNESDRRVRFLWGHHPAYDSPPGTVIDLPGGATFEIGETSDDGQTGPAAGSRGVWPDAASAAGGHVDLSVVPAGPVSRVCFLRDAGPWYALRPPSAPGIALAWDGATFPALWLWQSIGASGYPTYGRARITALEPQRTAPGDGLAAAIERGEALVVEPHGSRETWLTATLLPEGSARVRGVDRSGRVSTVG